MAVCVVASGSSLSISSTAVGSCVDYVLLTASDYAAQTPVYTPQDAALIAGAVASVWSIAWGIKIIRRVL